MHVAGDAPRGRSAGWPPSLTLASGTPRTNSEELFRFIGVLTARLIGTKSQGSSKLWRTSIPLGIYGNMHGSKLPRFSRVYSSNPRKHGCPSSDRTRLDRTGCRLHCDGSSLEGVDVPHSFGMFIFPCYFPKADDVQMPMVLTAL